MYKNNNDQYDTTTIYTKVQVPRIELTHWPLWEVAEILKV